MAEETSPIFREPKTLQAGAEELRASLADNLGTLEEGIKDAWHGATAAATRAAEGVKSAAETTVHAVQGAAHSTSEAMGRAFDVPAHVRRHLWLMVGGAMLLGVAHAGDRKTMWNRIWNSCAKRVPIRSRRRSWRLAPI